MGWLSHEKGEGTPSAPKGKESSSLLGGVEVMWNVLFFRRYELMVKIIDEMNFLYPRQSVVSFSLRF